MKVLHERSRLLILTSLARNPDHRLVFNELRDSLGFTAGNLSAHLKTLDAAGYTTQDKRFVGNKPQTTVVLTDEGFLALNTYLDELEALLKTLRGDEKQ